MVDVHNEMLRLGYSVFDGEYDMNVVGLRRVPGTVNAFDDLMTLSFKEKSSWRFFAWPCTTEPGGKYLGQPMNVIGTAIIKPGQYRGSHKLGIHGAGKKWAHEALVQCGDLKVWHDANKDQVLDYGLAETTSHGTSGLNLHRHLGDFSAGCQVFEKRQHQEEFIFLVKQQIAANLGNKFTYTVLEWPAANF
jgi:hypothetical protein